MNRIPVLDKEQRRRNWPSIERALRSCAAIYVDKLNKSAMRQYYIDEKKITHLKVEYGRDLNIGLAVRLLLQPDKMEESMTEFDVMTGTSGYFFTLQGGILGTNVNFYFGRNSLFHKRESEIYEKYFSQFIQKKRIGHANLWNELLLITALPQLSRIQVNPYCQSWRLDQERFELLKKRSSLQFIFNYKKRVDQLSYSFCMIEWAHRNSEYFDPSVQPIISYFREFYLKSKPPIRLAYQYTLEQKLDSWADSEAAGGKMYVAIQYNNQQSLEAYLPLLSPNSRYPCDPNDCEDTIRSLPPLTGDRGNRISYQVLADLWEAGFSIQRKNILENNVLFLEINIPLTVAYLGKMLLYKSFVRDMTNLEERIEARQSVFPDTIEPETTGRLVYYLEPLKGNPRVGARAWLEDEPIHKNQLRELDVSVDPKIQSIVLGHEPQEFMEKLLNYEEYICGHGTTPPWTNPLTNGAYSKQRKWQKITGHPS